MGKHDLSAAEVKRHKKRRKNRIIQRISLTVLAVCLIALAVIGYGYWSNTHANRQLANDVLHEGDGLASMAVDWAELEEVNPDIVAWVIVPGTPINYPVVQCNDNEKYLSTNFDGTVGTTVRPGCIFMDCTNESIHDDLNVIMYGHHLSDGSMFAALSDFVDQQEFNDHRTIYVLTPEMNYELTTVACVKAVGSEMIVQTSFSNPRSYVEYRNRMLDRSCVEQQGTVIEPSSIDRLFMFATCEYSQRNGRAVIYAAITNQAEPTNS